MQVINGILYDDNGQPIGGGGGGGGGGNFNGLPIAGAGGGASPSGPAAQPTLSDAAPGQTFAGFGASDLSQYFGITPDQANALASLANTGQASSGLQGIDPNRLSSGGDIQWGLEHLSEHPMGSHYHNNFLDSVAGNVLLNFATGGYYGLGKGLYNASQSGKFSDAWGGFNQLGPYGGTVYPVNKQAGTAGNLAGAGAGIGAGLTGGAGASGGTSGAALDTGPGAMVGVNDAGEKLYLVKTGTGVTEMTAEQAAQAGIPAMTTGGMGTPGSPGGSTGAALGASAGSQLAKMLPSGGGAAGTPSAFPQGGAFPGGPSPSQLSAIASEKHPGLAPWYRLRQQGQMPPGGIAENSMNAIAQNPQMWSR